MCRESCAEIGERRLVPPGDQGVVGSLGLASSSMAPSVSSSTSTTMAVATWPWAPASSSAAGRRRRCGGPRSVRSSVAARMRANSSSTDGASPRRATSRPAPRATGRRPRGHRRCRHRQLPGRAGHLSAGAAGPGRPPPAAAERASSSERSRRARISSIDRPHPLDRCGHLVPGRPELLDLDRQGTPAARQVGHDAPAGLLHLLQKGAALLLGPGDHRLALGHGVEPDPLDLASAPPGGRWPP